LGLTRQGYFGLRRIRRTADITGGIMGTRALTNCRTGKSGVSVDRLTFNGTIIETGTDSYRLAQTRARAGQNAS
jgi:hypothetical protein